MEIFKNKYVAAILNHLEDGVFITDHKGITIWMNDTSLKQLGSPRSKLIGKDVDTLEQEGYFTPSVTKQVIEQDQIVSQAQESLDRQYLATGKKLRFGEGEELIVTQVKDITETVRASLKVERAEYLLQKYWEELQQRKKEVSNDSDPFIIGNSQAHNDMMRLIEQIAPYDATVLLQGETGVGKSLIAKALHQKSDRKDAPFMQINCGAIPETLLESELFGYKRGAFTGADQAGKKGLVAKADGGTLFLDEIAELPLTLQAKILQLIQDKTFIPIGGTNLEQVDIRIISATNEDLLQKMDDKTFRKDLYYRLNVVSVHIPALRERKSDIIPLLYHYINVYTEKYGKQHSFQDEALQALQEYDWPGNIRELENMVERLVITATSSDITHEQLPDHIREIIPSATVPLNNLFQEQNLVQYMEGIEKQVIARTQKQFASTRKAADFLGITQSSYMRRLKKYNLS